MRNDCLQKWLADRFIRVAFLFACAGLLPLSAAPKRIVSLSPNTTEILYGVGAFPNVVAVSQFCSYPPEALKLPRVGGWQTSDAEKIVMLRPDLVVLTRPQGPFISDKLAAFSLKSLAVPSDTLSDVFSAIAMIGDATGHVEQAKQLAAQTHATIDQVKRETAKLPVRTAVIVISRTPGSLSEMYVATQGSYLVELLSIAGGRSVTEPSEPGYVKLSKEALLAANPDVIIDLVHTSGSHMGEHSTDVWKDLPELQAVRSKRVYELDDPFVVHPSQFVAHTAEVFARILHPEIAGALH